MFMHWHETGNRAPLTCSVFMEVMELICPDIWFMLPPLAMTPMFMLLLLLYIPPLGCVEYCDWDCWGYTLKGGKHEHDLHSQKDTNHAHIRSGELFHLLLPAAGGDVGRLGPSVEVGARLVARCSYLAGTLGLALALVLLQHGALTLPHPGGQQGALRGRSPAWKAWHWVLVLLLLAHSYRLEQIKGS